MFTVAEAPALTASTKEAEVSAASAELAATPSLLAQNALSQL